MVLCLMVVEGLSWGWCYGFSVGCVGERGGRTFGGVETVGYFMMGFSLIGDRIHCGWFVLSLLPGPLPLPHTPGCIKFPHRV